MVDATQGVQAVDCDNLYAYHRALAEAAAIWARLQAQVSSELRLSVANACAMAAEEHRQAGWDRWASVNTTMIALAEAVAADKGVHQAYAAYQDALVEFHRGQWKDCCTMQERIAAEVKAVNEETHEAYKQGYSDYTEALRKACGLMSSAAADRRHGEEQKKKEKQRALKSRKADV